MTENLIKIFFFVLIFSAMFLQSLFTDAQAVNPPASGSSTELMSPTKDVVAPSRAQPSSNIDH